jgi:multiple sugar transport system permease protein
MNRNKAIRLRKKAGTVVFHIFVITLGFLMLYPLLWMVSNSFKPQLEIFNSYSLLPQDWTLDNYTRGWQFNRALSFGVFFGNSFFYASIATVGAVLASSFVAFGFSRVKFAGNSFWYVCMFLTMMIPYQVVMIPQFIIFFHLNWINTFLPLIVPHFCGGAFFIFMIIQFIRGIPKELDESAMIDGCSRYRIYSRIILPLVKPALITTAIFSFYYRWDDFMGPLLYLNSPQSYTVSLALRMFADPQTSTDWGSIFAMGTLSLVPVLLIFAFFQKYIVEGIATQGLKG